MGEPVLNRGIGRGTFPPSFFPTPETQAKNKTSKSAGGRVFQEYLDTPPYLMCVFVSAATRYVRGLYHVHVLHGVEV